MSSSGLIYAVIVGAWAAYLVPMWLRRQDELNEARPTERFSTAIRLLAGRSALERRVARSLGDDDDNSTSTSTSTSTSAPASDAGSGQDAGAPERRARLLARRRRMVTTLFLAFAAGAVTAAVAGVAFLWIPAVPAVLLTLYIGHLRRLERQRYEVKLDRARAAQAAERLRERERARVPRSEPASADVEDRPAERASDLSVDGSADHAADHLADRPGDGLGDPGRPHLRLAADAAARREPAESSAAALVEATDHEEWVDGMRENGAAGPESWEPVPVPLPTYVTAPVAPRITRGLDLNARGIWDSGRAAEPRKTPLFDQYAEAAPSPSEDDCLTRPRAANE
ncbi:hypothetical protein [Kitasatospora sp. GP82]|uniref:divisome protein SepX/GlpR n=1 Tax=Kitasatospora sp. GP82 TaxID=3035089 RepID=UPI00247546AC|nr:hypothetical protein [Kitasatospora sp. GP82]MDH6127923.1 hypothetical protein [Kitasatospora sp. GP82]